MYLASTSLKAILTTPIIIIIIIIIILMNGIDYNPSVIWIP